MVKGLKNSLTNYVTTHSSAQIYSTKLVISNPENKYSFNFDGMGTFASSNLCVFCNIFYLKAIKARRVEHVRLCVSALAKCQG